MYSTCLFCNQSLGTNEAVEHFPIGRRLAFDAAKGRLWVVCPGCERWNLTPIEERWEAIEECEKLFRDTRLRVSTDNIGLARVKSGLELVRIGSPQRPELAAWRYGDQFGRRRTRHILYTAGAITLGVGIVVAGRATGIIAGGGYGMWNIGRFAFNAIGERRVRTRIVVPGDSDQPAIIRRRHLRDSALTPHDEGFELRLAYERPRAPSGLAHTHRDFRGQEALHVAGKLLPAVNDKGAKAEQVQDAVRFLEETSEPSMLFARLAKWGKTRAPNDQSYRRRARDKGASLAPGAILSLPLEARLALEMAAHEESERRAMEGELAVLEQAWREAEEIARIADDLLLPDEIRERVDG